MRVKSAPCALRGLQQLERHRQTCDTGACALGTHSSESNEDFALSFSATTSTPLLRLGFFHNRAFQSAFHHFLWCRGL